ncbi:MAG: hypothetical protein ACD_38C00068G0003 [uncultured bacterium]|nr:MAG: hypothetical protein ACD_38C00068G0003 [uncultured bacterium]
MTILPIRSEFSKTKGILPRSGNEATPGVFAWFVNTQLIFSNPLQAPP